MLRLRAVQDETGGFLTFIPLLYQVGDTRLVPRQASAVEALRVVATSRLVLDNFPHIEAYWVMMGEEAASIALHFGADDVNGTLVDERIAHAAKAESPGRARPRADPPHDPRRRPGARRARRPLQRHQGVELMLRVGRISYLNVEPFFHAFPWPIADSLPPRALGEAVAEGRVDAGPLALADCLRLEETVTRLPFGIVGPTRAQSVLLFADRPMGGAGRPPDRRDRRDLDLRAPPADPARVPATRCRPRSWSASTSRPTPRS